MPPIDGIGGQLYASPGCRQLRFHYRGAHRDGRIERGKVVAASRKDAQRILIERGVHPFEVVQLATPAWRRSPIPAADLAVTLRLLADLLDAGLPLARALQQLATAAPPTMANALPAVLAAVREGKGFVAALTRAEVRVPPEIAAIIRAGERGSGFARAVRDAALFCDDSVPTRTALRGALTYPALLAIGGVASLGLLVGVALSRVAVMQGDLRQSLPLATRIVLRTDDVGRAGALPAIAIVMVALVALFLFRSSRVIRRDQNVDEMTREENSTRVVAERRR